MSSNGVKASDRPPEKVCNVDDCGAWKTGELDFCHHHKGMASNGTPEEGNQRAMKTGLHSDPVNLFNWLAENDEAALAYILGKLHDYSERAPEPVYEANVEDADSFEEVETSLTAYGDDVLFMCIRDYARKKAQKRQLEEGLITQQKKAAGEGVMYVKDSNPVNLDLDRMDKTTMRQKDKLGLLPSPEKEMADAASDMGEKVARILQGDGES
jgi:hypothetical protein